jgi:hypothetical protein
MTAQETAARLAARTTLSTRRKAEYRAAEVRATTTLDAYWAGSATASVLRDYQAGRVTTIKAGR